jgi:hypothetical protein
VDELLFAARKAPKKRAPQRKLVKGGLDGAKPRGPPVDAGGAAEHADARALRQRAREVRRVSRPGRELIRVDDRQRVERERLERETHAVEREVVEHPPHERAGRGMDYRAVAPEGESGVEEPQVLAAVIQ